MTRDNGSSVQRQPVGSVQFPFGVSFQKTLVRLLCEDPNFASAVLSYLASQFFENDALSWAFERILAYHAKYDAIPPLPVLLDESRRVDSSVAQIYQATLEEVRIADLTAEQWLRDQVLEFIRRNVFVKAFRDSREQYNQGDFQAAYDTMMEAVDRISNVQIQAVDREFFFEAFSQRQAKRLSGDAKEDPVPTGIFDLDKILNGGLSRGELGIWVAYPKRGKSTLLVNHGVQAIRRANVNVLHLIYEGKRQMASDRYDAIFAQEQYWQIRRGDMSEERVRALQYEYGMYRQKLVIRGFTEHWDYSVESIHEEIRGLQRQFGWEPALVIIDYGDLLKGRGKYRDSFESQRTVYRDIKTLANRGYAIWTASQAQRPSGDVDMSSEILKSRRVADCYDKVRVADFLGTINQTLEERKARQMRLFAELYRDNEADKVISVKADFAKMTISSVVDPSEGIILNPVHAPIPLGYKSGGTTGKYPTQRRAPL
jgi:replicative DNA helicase